MGSKTIQAEFDEIERRGDWDNVYYDIKTRSECDAKEKNLTVDESNRPHNRRLNRYRDVNPYDHSRIVLKRGDTDYINANLVRMDRANRRYILTQGPLQNTVAHFWTMVWEQNSRAILMLNKIIEKKQVKCHVYWPEQTGALHRMELTDVGLCVELLRSEEFENYTKRVLRLTDTRAEALTADGDAATHSREVLQFQYNTWPDFGVPSTPMAFLQFLKQVRSSGVLDPEIGPAIVHCSAGIGRSGTFCLVDSCLVLFDNDNSMTTVREVLLELRHYRLGLIQTAPQLYFSYKAIIEGIRHFNDPSFYDYEEVPMIPSTTDIDSVPPPVPPTRAASLHLNKPLPRIPHSISVQGLDLEARTEVTAGGDSGYRPSAERPLPPLPATTLDNSFVEETHNDEADESDDSCDSDIDDSDSNNDDYEGNGGDNGTAGRAVDQVVDDDEDDINDDSSSSSNDVVMHDRAPPIVPRVANSNGTGAGSAEASFDANATLPPSPTDRTPPLNGLSGDVASPGSNSSSNAVLRQRRQEKLKERVNQIRDNQREAEEAPKKRRRMEQRSSDSDGD